MTGLIQLRESAGPGLGRTHGIYLRRGWVVAVDTPAHVARVDARGPLSAKLDALFALTEARLTFHVVCAPPQTESPPISPSDYLRGRPRARDRVTPGMPRSAPRVPSAPRTHTEALSTLGLDVGATTAEVTRAFRRRARELHPDLHRSAAFAERRSVEQRFAVLSAAYHTLMR
jgi:hypothetical protein